MGEATDQLLAGFGDALDAAISDSLLVVDGVNLRSSTGLVRPIVLQIAKRTADALDLPELLAVFVEHPKFLQGTVNTPSGVYYIRLELLMRQALERELADWATRRLTRAAEGLQGRDS